MESMYTSDFFINPASTAFPQLSMNSPLQANIQRLQVYQSARQILIDSRSGMPNIDLVPQLRHIQRLLSGHFAAEEALMIQSNWAETAEHIIHHRILEKSLRFLTMECEVDATSFTDLYRFLVTDLVLGHLNGYDKELYQFLQTSHAANQQGFNLQSASHHPAQYWLTTACQENI